MKILSFVSPSCSSEPIRRWSLFKTQIKVYLIKQYAFCPFIENPAKQNLEDPESS